MICEGVGLERGDEVSVGGGKGLKLQARGKGLLGNYSLLFFISRANHGKDGARHHWLMHPICLGTSRKPDVGPPSTF